MYKILLLNEDGTYRYHQIDDGTKVEDFDVNSLDDLELECIKLLYVYNASQILPIADVKYSVDLLWADPDPDNQGQYFPGLNINGITNPNPTGKNVKFKILIKKGENSFGFHAISKEIMVTSKTGVTIGSGIFEDVDYEATGFEDLEKTSLELLKDYPYTSVRPVICLEFAIDLLWTNIDGLTVAMQQKTYDIATYQQIINTIKGGGTT